MSRAAIIVDDEAPARERMRRLLSAHQEIEVVAEANAGDAAVRLVAELKPELVLLDVRMPGMNGLEAAKHMATLEQPPAVIFTTAYEQYAVEAFEADGVGYLLKPVRPERLAAALGRAARLGVRELQGLQRSAAARTHIAARVRDGIRLVPVEEIYYFAADHKYTTVRHGNGAELIEDSLRILQTEFAEQFVRIHRNALVALRHIASIERAVAGTHCVVLRDIDERLQVSRRMASELRERLRL